MTLLTPPPRLPRALTWLLIIAGFFLFFYAIRSVLAPFIVGVLIAYFLDPAADRLQKAGLSRGMATATISIGFFCILLTATLLVVPAVAKQLAGLIVALPVYLENLQARYGATFMDWYTQLGLGQDASIKSAVSDVSGAAVSATGGFLAGIFHGGLAAFNIFGLVMISPLVAFYMLRDWDDIVAAVNRLLPLAYAPAIREQIHKIDEVLSGFIRGQINVCLLLAAYYSLGLSLTGLNFGFIIGLLTGLFSFLPYLGFASGCLLGITIALLQWHGELVPVLMVAGVFTGGQILESYFLTPKLVGDKVGLHPMWIIFGVLAGGALLGFAGVVLSVPLTAVIGVLIRFFVAKYLNSPLYRSAVGAPPAPPVVL